MRRGFRLRSKGRFEFPEEEEAGIAVEGSASDPIFVATLPFAAVEGVSGKDLRCCHGYRDGLTLSKDFIVANCT